MHEKGCPQPIEGVLDIEVIDQFHRYNTFGYGVKINVDQSKNPQKDKKYSIALNLRSIRFFNMPFFISGSLQTFSLICF